jgi:phosphoribosylglycinamide formyltransferase-1
MKNIAIFASGRGSNFSAILKAAKRGVFKAGISLLVCDNPGAKVLEKARKANIKVALVKRQDFPSKEKFEAEIIKKLEEENIGLIALAGFMRILSPGFVHKYKNRILNIHPALLPSYKGAQAIKDAFNCGAKFTGVTVHFVDEKTDHGPIILQEPVKIEKGDTLKSLENKIHKVEHKLYPEAIRLYLEGKLRVKGRKVKIL